MSKWRSRPSVQVASLAKMLSGDRICEWSAWFQAHKYDYERAPEHPEADRWKLRHARLLNTEVVKWKSEGYRVYVEDENRFKLYTFSGISGNVVGVPDLIAVKGREAIIVDVKGGIPRNFHKLQVLLYLWALPQACKWHAHSKLAGRLVYSSGEQHVLPEGLDEAFTTAIIKALRILFLFGERDKVPSWSECRWCPIASSECPDRIDRRPEDKFFADESK